MSENPKCRPGRPKGSKNQPGTKNVGRPRKDGRSPQPRTTDNLELSELGKRGPNIPASGARARSAQGVGACWLLSERPKHRRDETGLPWWLAAQTSRWAESVPAGSTTSWMVLGSGVFVHR
ncbi:hypothetical protein BU15DRAFT_59737 [Melanogaster broomeanus]|nr:hypothetical protein BU15DRAFT_59737 [Melanogaster broomeanus]